MQFPIQDHYIHMSRHRKATIRSKWTLFCVSLHVCNDLEWETAYEEAPKKNFQKNISEERERERKLYNVQFLGECGPCTGYHAYPWAGQSRTWQGMKCTDSDVSLVLSRSQYVHENTEFSLQSF